MGSNVMSMLLNGIMSIESAVSYPTQSDDWVKTILIGGILMFFGFLLIPLFIVYGYIVHTIRGRFDHQEELPAFADWGTLLVDGVKAWLIGFIWLLIPLIIAGMLIGGAIASAIIGGDETIVAAMAGLAVGLMISSILLFVFGYFAAAAIVNFAREGEFSAGFAFDTIKEVCFTSQFFIAWLLTVVAFIIAGAVGSIPAIGWILAPFVGFYAALVAANLLADGFDDAISSVGG